MPVNENTVNLSQFRGINNINSEDSLGADELRAGLNIDIDDNHGVSRRSGYSKVYSGSGIHSLYSDELTKLFVEGNSLKVLNDDNTATSLRSDLSLGKKMTYESVDGDIYYSDSQKTGVLKGGVNYPWGISVPMTQPILSSIAGAMPAGNYQVTTTYVSSDGLESGADIAISIDLADNNGIQLTGIPVSSDSRVAYVNIYLSSHNGDMLYLVDTVANGTTSRQITTPVYSSPLRSQFVSPPPAGEIVFYFKGRMYVVSGDTLYYSEPYALDWFILSKNYLRFPKNITIAVPVDDGIHISADKTYWMPGTNPAQPSLVVKSNAKGIFGTEARANGSYVGEGIVGDVYFWLSDLGLCLAGNSGYFSIINDDRYVNQNADSGAGVIKNENGINQYIGLLKDGGQQGNIAIGDTVTSAIIRNGVLIT